MYLVERQGVVWEAKVRKWDGSGDQNRSRKSDDEPREDEGGEKGETC